MENADDEGNVNPASVKKAQKFIAAIQRAFHDDNKVRDWAGESIDKKTGEKTFDNTADFQTDQFSDIKAAGLQYCGHWV